MLFERDLKHIIYRRAGNCLKKRGRNQNTFFLTQLFRCNPKLTKIASIKILKIYVFYSTIDNTLLHQNALFTSIYIYTQTYARMQTHMCSRTHIHRHTHRYIFQNHFHWWKNPRIPLSQYIIPVRLRPFTPKTLACMFLRRIDFYASTLHLFSLLNLTLLQYFCLIYHLNSNTVN